MAVSSFVNQMICPACIETGSETSNRFLASLSECADSRLTTFLTGSFTIHSMENEVQLVRVRNPVSIQILRQLAERVLDAPYRELR